MICSRRLLGRCSAKQSQSQRLWPENGGRPGKHTQSRPKPGAAVVGQARPTSARPGAPNKANPASMCLGLPKGYSQRTPYGVTTSGQDRVKQTPFAAVPDGSPPGNPGAPNKANSTAGSTAGAAYPARRGEPAAPNKANSARPPPGRPKPVPGSIRNPKLETCPEHGRTDAKQGRMAESTVGPVAPNKPNLARPVPRRLIRHQARSQTPYRGL